MVLDLIVVLFTKILDDKTTESRKDMLQGYLRGQLSPDLGAYQVEALRREF